MTGHTMLHELYKFGAPLRHNHIPKFKTAGHEENLCENGSQMLYNNRASIQKCATKCAVLMTYHLSFPVISHFL